MQVRTVGTSASCKSFRFALCIFVLLRKIKRNGVVQSWNANVNTKEIKIQTNKHATQQTHSQQTDRRNRTYGVTKSISFARFLYNKQQSMLTDNRLHSQTQVLYSAVYTSMFLKVLETTNYINIFVNIYIFILTVFAVVLNSIYYL